MLKFLNNRLLIIIFIFAAQLPPSLCVADFNAGSLREQISAAIDTKGKLGKYDISIDVRAGEVTLDGQVASLDASRLIEEATRSVAGVREVTNNLYINHAWYTPASAHITEKLTPAKPSDSEVNTEVRNALAREAGIDLGGLQIQTKNGVVTIEGKQASFRDIDRILSIALMVEGVTDIKSGMTVQGKPYPLQDGINSKN